MTVADIRVTDPDHTSGTGRVATSGRSRRWLPIVAVLVLAGALAGSATIGAVPIALSALWDTTHPDHAIALSRLDRTWVAAAVGAALALAGALMQGLTRNPIADPGLLGVNAGASLAIVLAISFFDVTALSGQVWFALAGAAVAAVMVHAIAALGAGGATPVKIAVAGAAMTAAVTSVTSGILLVDRASLDAYRNWVVGSTSGRGLDVLLTGAPFLLVGAALAFAGARLLDALALGDDVARGLGRRTALDRAVLGLAIVLLAGTATALVGPVAFIGLVVPHIVRTFVGAHHRLLLPWSAVVGAALVLAADTIGRVVLPPGEVQVGVMAAAVGLPFFLVLIRRTRVGGL